ncbi:hypothetical protein SLS54_002860 [Diplodia seriata]
MDGSPDTTHKVGKPNLPKPSNDCVLQNVSVSGGKIITGGINVAIGLKERPIHVIQSGYIPRLEWIHQKYSVFWDEKHKRGWLVNGTTALLHLVRSAWKAKEDGPFKVLLKTKSECLLEAKAKNTTESAIEVLTNAVNKQLKIYADGQQQDGTPKYIRFEDLVGQVYNVFEKMIDHQNDSASRAGKSLKCRVRKHIDGWNFEDVILNRDCDSAVATLQEMGKGWVDLVHDIKAVTFLGQNFGELIKPTPAAEYCTHWAQLPVDSYYLGVCVSDIVQIIQSYGGQVSTEPTKLTASIGWPDSDNRFRRCECGPQQDHSDLSQKLGSSERCKSLIANKELALNGAVIFRHNIELTGTSLSRMFHRERRKTNDSCGLMRPNGSVAASSQTQSPTESSTCGNRPYPGSSLHEALTLQPSPPSEAATRGPTGFDQEMYGQSERKNIHTSAMEEKAERAKAIEGCAE